jgi:uncharacterized protein (DUF1501 family)
MAMQALMHILTGRDGVLSRRTFLRSVGAGAAATGMLGWKDAVALQADELRRRGMACILLFMRGGPSQFETFNPKPGVDTGGPTQAIATAVTGVQLAERWTNVARALADFAVIRSLTNREGEHQRAAYQMHTGYVPNGAVRYPSFGSTVASEIAPREFDLPHFVSVGNRITTLGPGFLPMTYAPFVVTNPNQMPNNAELPQGVGGARLGRRLALMQQLEQDFAQAGGQARVRGHRALYGSAAQMVRSPRLRAFDLSQERDAVRDRYGRNAFGQGCLLARRLVEAGVTFVEIDLAGWDTHQDNFNRTRTLSEQADPALAALVKDLKDRGRLERTLVIWMGEFGRTPRINPNTGRDHFPLAFSIVLAGGGVRGGRVIGATNATGTEVTARPVTVPDLFCTFCRALGIDPRKEHISPLGRPVRIVDGGQPIQELFA